MEVAVSVTLLGQGVLIVNPQSKRYIAYLSRQFPPVMETFFFVGVYRWFDFSRNESLISVKDLFILCDARYPRLQLTNEIDIQSRSVLLCFDERIWDPGILYSWRFDGSMEEQIMFGINNITRPFNLIKKTMARNDDFIILGLILKKKRNRFTIGWRVRLRYPKHRRNSLLDHFYLCLSLSIIDVRLVYKQLLDVI
ncbi:unnamed protein product [Brassica rapa]|uniref:Uncharacterized protein n=3 Tax=Brassica TaxID=3705 RepID=A0A8D9G2M9_BRACM|nr:unnamed protein product [Brassica napus]CAG7865052.1 unnamed protein product [Brassica rapa]